MCTEEAGERLDSVLRLTTVGSCRRSVQNNLFAACWQRGSRWYSWSRMRPSGWEDETGAARVNLSGIDQIQSKSQADVVAFLGVCWARLAQGLANFACRIGI